MQSPTADDLAHMVGHRVVLRYRIRPESASAPGPGATDVLGILDHADAATAVVRTADEQLVSVSVDDVLAARIIPVRAVPRRKVRDLEAAALLGWQADEVAGYGGWLLRASHGFTRRANSVLPLAEPRVPLGPAIDHVQRWYRDRGLSPTFQVVELLGADLTEALDARGWAPPTGRTLVMTGSLDAIGAPAAGDVRIDDHPDDPWLARYYTEGGTRRSSADRIIAGTGASGPVSLGFASVRADDGDDPAVAIARGAVSSSPAGQLWLGITAVQVAPDHRRRGLATTLVAALAAWARDRDATDGYVQVEVDNTGAQQTYVDLGFAPHHHYHYRHANP